MSVMMRNGLQYAGVPNERLDNLEEIVGDGQQSVGSDLTDAVTQLNSSLVNYLVVRNQTGTITRAHGSNSNITAQTVAGYTFLCWLNVISNGWIGNLYIERPDLSSTRVWSSNYGYSDTGSGLYVAYALYVKN
jgi:hypothetical protein